MRISVALCSYHGAKSLPAQLDSLARQERLPDELIVCDDASTDGSARCVEEFARAAPFPVHLHVNAQNVGSTRNFEHAFGRCSGDLIAPCDQDDCWLPQKLRRLEETFATSPQLGLVCSDGYLTDDALEKTGQRIWPNLPFPPAMQREFNAGAAARLLLRYNVVSGATMAFRREMLPLALPIPACWVHDAWIALIAAALGPVRALPEPLILYRQHGQQQIGVSALTFKTQLGYARRMDLAYCTRQVDCFQAFAERLAGCAKHVADPALLGQVQHKIAFARARVAMRQTNRLGRIVLAARELLRGRYHQYGRGSKGFLADALL